MGHCISVKQKLRRSPTILNLQQILSTGDLHLIRVTSFRRKIATLFADIHLLRDRENGADFVLRYHFRLISNFHMLFILKSAPCRLTPNEALPISCERSRTRNLLRLGLCPKDPQGTLSLDPASPLTPGPRLRFISRSARC